MERIIFLNGASCAGKSSIAGILKNRLGYRHDSIDVYLGEIMGLSSPDIYDLSDKQWDEIVENFYARAAAAASSGNTVIIDDVLNTFNWSKIAARHLAPYDVTLVRVYCPLNLLISREMKRRYVDDAAVRSQFYTVHRNKRYDIAVDTSRMSLEQCADTIEIYCSSNSKPALSIAEKLLGNKAHLMGERR